MNTQQEHSKYKCWNEYTVVLTAAFTNQYCFHTNFMSSQIIKSKPQLHLHVPKYAKMHTNNYKSSNAMGL